MHGIEPLRLEGVSNNGNRDRIRARELVETADREKNILIGIFRVVFGCGHREEVG